MVGGLRRWGKVEGVGSGWNGCWGRGEAFDLHGAEFSSMFGLCVEVQFKSIYSFALTTTISCILCLEWMVGRGNVVMSSEEI